MIEFNTKCFRTGIWQETAISKYITLNKSTIVAIGNIGGDKAFIFLSGP